VRNIYGNYSSVPNVVKLKMSC